MKTTTYLALTAVVLLNWSSLAWACSFSTAGCQDIGNTCGPSQVCAFNPEIGNCACRARSLITPPLDPKFFANQDFQAKVPSAFVLQPQTLPFVQQSLIKTRIQGHALFNVIHADGQLSDSISRFSQLQVEAKLNILKKVFQMEVALLKIAPPQLIFDKKTLRATFFDFDPAHPSPGRVILNPDLLFQDPIPYAPILFLIHETRHSEQFQLAFGPKSDPGKLGQVYRSAFVVQRAILDKHLSVSFCDFLTLANEYEAFQFGNLVTGALTSGKVDTTGMGTWASQYLPNGELRINLYNLAQKVGPSSLLRAFNEIEKGQYRPSH